MTASVLSGSLCIHLYALAFSPSGDLVAASTSDGKLWVWKTETGKKVAELQAHGINCASYRLCWHPTDPDLIATGGTDFCANIHSLVDKGIRRSYKHPNVVIGVEFNPSRPHLLATGCQDGVVRLWDTTIFPHEHRPGGVVSGHAARVFNVQWHPFFSNVLASGSDDKTIRVWDIDRGCEAMVLRGHTSRAVWGRDVV